MATPLYAFENRIPSEESYDPDSPGSSGTLILRKAMATTSQEEKLSCNEPGRGYLKSSSVKTTDSSCSEWPEYLNKAEYKAVMLHAAALPRNFGDEEASPPLGRTRKRLSTEGTSPTAPAKPVANQQNDSYESMDSSNDLPSNVPSNECLLGATSNAYPPPSLPNTAESEAVSMSVEDAFNQGQEEHDASEVFIAESQASSPGPEYETATNRDQKWPVDMADLLFSASDEAQCASRQAHSYSTLTRSDESGSFEYDHMIVEDEIKVPQDTSLFQGPYAEFDPNACPLKAPKQQAVKKSFSPTKCSMEPAFSQFENGPAVETAGILHQSKENKRSLFKRQRSLKVAAKEMRELNKWTSDDPEAYDTCTRRLSANGEWVEDNGNIYMDSPAAASLTSGRQERSPDYDYSEIDFFQAVSSRNSLADVREAEIRGVDSSRYQGLVGSLNMEKHKYHTVEDEEFPTAVLSPTQQRKGLRRTLTNPNWEDPYATTGFVQAAVSRQSSLKDKFKKAESRKVLDFFHRQGSKRRV